LEKVTFSEETVEHNGGLLLNEDKNPGGFHALMLAIMIIKTDSREVI